MDLEQALTTTGAIRSFSERPVDDDVLIRVLDRARFAPNGGNRQAWRTVVVKDRATRERLRDLYLLGWYEYLAIGAAGLVPWAPITDRGAESEAVSHAAEMASASGATYGGFAERLDRVPVLLVIL